MKNNTVLLSLLAIAAMAMFAEPALAATTGTVWDTPLQTLREAFTGPIALTLSVLGIAAAGGMLIFGGELSTFTRSMVMLVMVIAVLVGATTFLTGFFGTTTATIHPGIAALPPS